jgi:hypothetical protein
MYYCVANIEQNLILETQYKFSFLKLWEVCTVHTNDN